MTYILWDEFKTVFPRDEPIYDTVRYFAFLLEDTIIWYDCFVTPYNNFFAEGEHVFTSVQVDVDGTSAEAVHMSNGIEEFTVLCPEMITAMFLSEPDIVERWIEEDKDGYLPAVGWKFDRAKTDFPRFYKEEADVDGNPYRIWGNGAKEYI